MWTRWVQEDYSRSAALADLQQGSEHVRVWALRLLVDEARPDARSLGDIEMSALRKAAQQDSSGLVQLYLASALQRLPWDDRWPIAEVLAGKTELAQDRMFPLLVWYGIEPAVGHDPARAVRAAQVGQIRFWCGNTSPGV